MENPGQQRGPEGACALVPSRRGGGDPSPRRPRRRGVRGHHGDVQARWGLRQRGPPAMWFSLAEVSPSQTGTWPSSASSAVGSYATGVAIGNGGAPRLVARLASPHLRRGIVRTAPAGRRPRRDG